MERADYTSRWAYAVRGILAVLFGVLILAWPGISLLTFLYTFATFAFIYGVIALVSGLMVIRSKDNWWWLVIVGIIGIVVALVTFFWPGVTTLLLVYFVAAWAIATGIAEIGAVTMHGTFHRGEWVLVAAGVVSILVGLYLFLFPGAGVLSLLLVIGVFAIVYGVLQFVHMFMPSPRTTAV